jgi:hypothetical protein
MRDFCSAKPCENPTFATIFLSTSRIASVPINRLYWVGESRVATSARVGRDGVLLPRLPNAGIMTLAQKMLALLA